ncbi:fibronectin type III domain-containing protein [candidate division KSB1 bacterium]|nr:fibronectin type III domain-containing protein [candidate division KSB1 bacterium]
MLKFFYKLVMLVLVVFATSLFSQSRSTTCSRFGIDVGSTGGLSGFDWPRDFRYASNGGNNQYDILIENWNKAGGNLNGYAVPGDIEVGAWMTVYNKKTVKYKYPTVLVAGQDITDPDVYDAVDAKLPADQVIETLATTYLGLSLCQRVYAWSHPNYQDFVLVHQQWINTGNTDADPKTKELPDNSFSNFYLFEINTFKPGDGSHDEMCDRNHTKADRSDIYSSTEIWAFEGDDPTQPGVIDPNRPQLLHVSVGPDPNDRWFGKTVNNEGDPKPETGEFMSPMYVGEGIIHIDKSAQDRTNDLGKLKMLRWDEYYWLFHGETQAREDRYNVYRNGYHSEFFVADQNPDDSNIYSGSQRCLSTFGPWDGFAIGDTINLVFVRAAKGISSQMAREKGAEWLNWWQNGQGTFNDQEKNKLLRTGKDSLIACYNKAKTLWENHFKLPEGWNPQPPQKLEIINTDSNYLALTWLEPANSTNISKYNIYYAIGSRDAQYELLAMTTHNPGQTQYQYIYRNPKPGFAHYFNLTAVDMNGNESSQYLCRTNRLAIYPGLAKGESMKDVRVVPNPFVYDKNAVENYTGERDKIMIAGLPPGRTEIRIYTLTGDLVRFLVHDVNTGGNDGLDYSDLKKGRRYLTISDNNQYIASGVYIYQVKSLDGHGEKTGKFIVIR